MERSECSLTTLEPVTSTRAEPMAPEDRRAMIAEQSVPLFLEHGSGLTTRQLAEELGIAEGTIFRAFGDKDALKRAAVEAFFARGHEQLERGIVDPALPLEEKVAALVHGTRLWTRNMMRMLSLVDRSEIPSFFAGKREDIFRTAVARIFEPNSDELTVPPERMAPVMRLAGMAANAAHFDKDASLSDDELVHFILYGIAGRPRGED